MTELTKDELKEILKSHKDNNSFQDWIIENKLEGNSEMDLIKDMDFVSYAYDKYYDTYFSYKIPSGFNIRVANFGEIFGDGTEKGYKATHIFQEQFAERLVLALTYFKGKTNDEIKQLLEKENINADN